MSLYNLTRGKSSKKQFVCKKCNRSVDIHQALRHFNSHITRDDSGVIRYCGYCDQTFLMHQDEARELMYRRHLYECVAGRQCPKKLFGMIEEYVHVTGVLNPFIVNVSQADNVNQKKAVLMAVELERPTASAAHTIESEPPALPSTSSSLPSVPLHEGIPQLSNAAKVQYIEKIDVMNVEQYWKEKRYNKLIHQSLEQALGQFTNPFKHQTPTEQHLEKQRLQRQAILFNEEIADHRRFFRRLLAIVRKKLQQQHGDQAVFYCKFTHLEQKIDTDLLRHMREHSDSSMVRICCKCQACFIFFNDYEEHLYLYHLLCCVLNLKVETDQDVASFVALCRQGYLVDPSCPALYDERAFLSGDRAAGLKGYRRFLANDPQSNAIFNSDRDGMLRVLQMLPLPGSNEDPALELQIRDTLRCYGERFDTMFEYQQRQDSVNNRWYDSQADFNCRKCARDKAAIDEGTFDRYKNTLGYQRINHYCHYFLTNDVFLSRFPPKWLIDISQVDYRERLPVEMGFHFWLVLIAQKLPYKHFSLFNDDEKKNKCIFMHLFVYMRYAQAILQELLSNESCYYILPYTCLCRDSSLVCGMSDDSIAGRDQERELDNAHRHLIVVFRNQGAFSTFASKTSINRLDPEHVRVKNCHRATDAAIKKRKLATDASVSTASRKREPVKTKYMIPILDHAHYYHTVRYVSRDKVALNSKKEDCGHDKPSHDRLTGFKQQPTYQDRQHDEDREEIASVLHDASKYQSANRVNHTRFSRHFYFSIPMVYHVKPCFFLLYPHGLTDWLAESFVVKHLLYRLLRAVRQKPYQKQDKIGIDYVVRLSDMRPYLNNYIGSHAFSLKAVPQDSDYPSEAMAEKECVDAGIRVEPNRVHFNELRYFDDLSHVEIALPPRLVRAVNEMINNNYQLVRFNLAMYQNLRSASEKIFWLHLRNQFLSDELKRLTEIITGTGQALTTNQARATRLEKELDCSREQIRLLTQSHSEKELEIAQLTRQIRCLTSVLEKME